MRDIESLPLVTTVVGSYPTDGMPPRRAIQRAIEDQVAAGIELVSDGQPRADMIGLFTAHIPGFRRADDGVWEVADALDLPKAPIAVEDFAFARQRLAGRAELKGIVTGPLTLALSCRVAPGAPYRGPEDPSLILRLAELMGREVAALVAAGATIVQVDEPMLSVALGARVSPELASDALRPLAAVPRTPALHVCGDIRAIAPELLALPFDVLDFENTTLPNLSAFDADELEFASVRLGVGCVNTRSSRAESVAAIRKRVLAATARIQPDRLWISPDCGLRNLPAEVARAKLTRMVAAVNEVRGGMTG
ncbi:MAG TPA: uroporphyrinogen decarboxylase family protein [Ktedonobacterales bacterium]|nr:uroporphyrinogen decarboxylase family protein [Ktedonobacterales bacterium]